jgi:hypothetical protein
MRTLKLSGNMTTGEEFTAGQIDRLTQERDALRAEVAALREALERVKRHGPIMGSRGDYRQGQLDVLESVARIAGQALAFPTQPQPQPEPPQPRTVKQWLETIPCPKWRAAALRNMDNPNQEEDSLEHAILGAFSWKDSAEGYAAWNRVYWAISTGTPLPPCPFGKEGA